MLIKVLLTKDGISHWAMTNFHQTPLMLCLYNRRGSFLVQYVDTKHLLAFPSLIKYSVMFLDLSKTRNPNRKLCQRLWVLSLLKILGMMVCNFFVSGVCFSLYQTSLSFLGNTDLCLFLVVKCFYYQLLKKLMNTNLLILLIY